ncbi:hypothetical protein P3T43_003914 [Paraburkholderia sp. GAS41]|uniref:winged helix-turn-helix transcriptional regulator n=1 Tax=Paraburkholderia sp. GAS41 TaxID=3035134 RepID=UPI003D1C8197
MFRLPSIDDGALLSQDSLHRGLADHVRSAEVASGTAALFALDCMSPAAIGHAVLSAIRNMRLDTLGLDAEAKALAQQAIRGSQSAAADTVLRMGSLELDLLKRNATHGGHTLDLRPTALRVLECLMRRADQVVTRTVIFEDVWNGHFDPHTNRIDVHVGHLRKQLAARSNGPQIHTFRGAGYMLR